MCVSSVGDYDDFLALLESKNGKTALADRKQFASNAFRVSSHYDTHIFNFFEEDNDALKLSYNEGKLLRYGENPHQKGTFFGNFEEVFFMHHGKALSYNNLLDVDAAVQLMAEFKDDARHQKQILDHRQVRLCRLVKCYHG